MKQIKITLCLCLLLLLTTQVMLAQKNIALGVKGGIGIPNLTAGDNSNPLSSGWSSRLGPYFGAVASFKVKSIFSIQVELNYSSQGGKKNGPQAIPTSYFTSNPPAGTPTYVYATLNNETRLNYIELPVLAKITLPLGGGLHFMVDAGPYAGFLVAAKNIVSGNTMIYADAAETVPLTTQPFTFNLTQDVKSDIKTFNLGVQAGIGLEQKLPLGYLTLTVGGNYGFIPIQKNKTNGQNNTGAATLTLGYLVAL